jgi:hypothetical protein
MKFEISGTPSSVNSSTARKSPANCPRSSSFEERSGRNASGIRTWPEKSYINKSLLWSLPVRSSFRNAENVGTSDGKCRRNASATTSSLVSVIRTRIRQALRHSSLGRSSWQAVAPKVPDGEHAGTERDLEDAESITNAAPAVTDELCARLLDRHGQVEMVESGDVAARTGLRVGEQQTRCLSVPPPLPRYTRVGVLPQAARCADNARHEPDRKRPHH